MTDLSSIDDGSDLEKAIGGNLQPLLSRLRNRYELSDETLNWIVARLEGSKQGRKKTGGKPNANDQLDKLLQYACVEWLTKVEKFTKQEACWFVAKILPGKADTIRKDVSKYIPPKSYKLKLIAVGFGGEEEKFLKTRHNGYRPVVLQRIGTLLSKTRPDRLLEV